METRSIRILKEGRLLFWTWLAVIFVGALKAIVPPLPWHAEGLFNFAAATGFWLGIPLLAALPFGEEFQNRTLPLLLSQPISRTKLWTEKWIVLVVASLSAALVYGFTFSERASGHSTVFWLLLVIISLCSSTFWTLLARSTIGGVVLNAIQTMLFVVILNLTQVVSGGYISTLGGASSMSATLELIIVAVALGYSAFMLWAGRLRLVGFQVTGSVAGEDLLTSKSNTTGGIVASLLRCKPTGALTNLIRKELRQLWPLWIITILAIIFVICIAPFHLAQPQDPSTYFVVILGLNGILAAVLAGSLSLGEERLSGTHLWHLTLPVSVREQWGVKLVVALVSSFLCITLVDASVLAFLGGSFWTASNASLGPHDFLLMTWFYALLTFAAFWCACAIKGTVRAILWVLPVCAAIVTAYGAALSLASLIILNPASTASNFTAAVVSLIHPYPIANTSLRFVWQLTHSRYAEGLWIGAPLLLVGLFQSLRMFRQEARDSALTLLRHLLLPAAVAFVACFVQNMPVPVLAASNSETRKVLAEIAVAVDKMHVDPAQLSATSTLQVNVDDLAKLSPISDTTRRWLRDSTIAIDPQQIPYHALKNGHMEFTKFPYLATVHLRNNWDCTIFPGFNPGYSFCTSPLDTWNLKPR